MLKAASLEVSAFGRPVGTLALAGNVAAFAYDDEWLAHGFSISPLSLPLERRVFVPPFRPFDGLYGIFADSLPDGWGRLLLDRLLARNGMDPATLSPLDRLAFVGSGGMGALEYQPSFEPGTEASSELADFDYMARECRRIFGNESSDDLDRLYRLGGSSGGARPKALVDIDGEAWIVKFHTTHEGPKVGLMEYAYALCARACGINVPEVRLLPSKECAGFFAIRRFDRTTADGRGAVAADVGDASASAGRLHMASAAALLETSHRMPSLDYQHLFQLTRLLSNDHAQLLELYRRMCFNVFSHNRDDHAKNFSFLCNSDGKWILSPAYDLTYSSSLGGEHATTVAGNGADPSLKDLLRVASAADLDARWAREEALRIQEATNDQLAEWL